MTTRRYVSSRPTFTLGDGFRIGFGIGFWMIAWTLALWFAFLILGIGFSILGSV